MPRLKLTAPTIEALETDESQVDYWDTLLPGFGVRVSKKGTKSWIVFPRVLVQGKWKKKLFTLDRYPTLTLKDAREMARKALALASEGDNPNDAIHPPTVEKVKRSRNSYGAVRDEFLKKYRTRKGDKPRPGTLDNMRRVLSSPRLREWETRPIAEITKRDVRDHLDNLIDEGKDSVANKTLIVVRMLFTWAYDREIIETIPTDRIRPPGAEKSRDRVLTDNELKAIWNATHGTGGKDSHIHGDIVRVLMLTGQRRNEVAGMLWREIDLDGQTWEIPGDRTKNKKPHIVPLTIPVVEILQRQQELQERIGKSALVFTTGKGKVFSGWSKSKERMDFRSGVTGWRLHDLRRSLVTGMNEMGIAPHVVEAVVNHVSGTRGGVAGVYNRSLLLEERRRALGAWARHVMGVVEDRQPEKVVRLDGVR